MIGVVSPPERWRSLGDGFRVDARLTVEERDDALVAPSGALFRDGGGWATYVVEDGRARRRAVDVGARGEREAAIHAGLAEGTRVVVYPSDAIAGVPLCSPLQRRQAGSMHRAVFGMIRCARAAQEVAEPRRWVKVWDVPTRVFHWLLVLLVTVGVYTGYFAPEWWMGVHVWTGYALVALMVFRLVWGVFGSEYSRVVSFAYPPRDTFEHLRGLLMLRPPHYVGHNPTGALMVFALTGVLLGLVVTGLLVLGGEEKQGPLAAVVGYSLGSPAKAVHGAFVFLLLTMVVAHVIGVVAESALIGDDLTRSMITGWKQLPASLPIAAARAARPAPAAVVVALLVAAAAWALRTLSELPPPQGLRVLAENAAYSRECGACHYPLNPSLLPAASWAGLMTNLADHFGDNASLDQQTTRELTMWLVANAAETWDTESANRFRLVAREEPFRVTATPYWVRKHSGIPSSVFASPPVRSKVNCNACHSDAETGRYDDQAIKMPNEEKR